MPSGANDEGFVLGMTLAPETLDALARRVADLNQARDDGFLNVEGAAEYLATTPAAVRRKVERGKIPHHRADGRVLFDRRELRAWVSGER